jgi:hypothetical protein
MSKSKDKIVKSALDSYGLGKKKEEPKADDFSFNDDYFKSLEDDRDFHGDFGGVAKDYGERGWQSNPYRQSTLFPSVNETVGNVLEVARRARFDDTFNLAEFNDSDWAQLTRMLGDSMETLLEGKGFTNKLSFGRAALDKALGEVLKNNYLHEDSTGRKRYLKRGV